MQSRQTMKTEPDRYAMPDPLHTRRSWSGSADARRGDLGTVLRVVLETGPVTTREISERAALSDTAAGQLAGDLVGAGLVVTARHGPSGRGIAAATYSARPDLAHAVGVTV